MEAALGVLVCGLLIAGIVLSLSREWAVKVAGLIVTGSAMVSGITLAGTPVLIVAAVVGGAVLVISVLRSLASEIAIAWRERAGQDKSQPPPA
jgi:hypothetical protein